MDTWEIQAERKRTELEPRDWDTYRAALLASGMVEESRQKRESDSVKWLEFDNGSRLAIKEAKPGTIRGMSPTLIDQLWEDHL